MENLALLVSINNCFANSLAEELCSELGYFFLDSKSLLEYELADRQKIIDTCGIPYLLLQEKKFIKNLTSFENTIIYIPCDLFVNSENYVILKDVSTIYLQFDWQTIQNDKNTKTIDKIVFNEYDKLLQKNCKYTIDCSSIKNEQILAKVRSVL